MLDPDKAQAVFEQATQAITQAISELKHQGAELNRRTAKMRDMRDKLRAVIEGTSAQPGAKIATD